MATLGREAYRSKVYACWLGKSIGGTLGGPHEGKQGPLNLTFYDPVPTEPMFNDDLDLQLVWLHAIEEHGLGVTPAHISQEWHDHITYPWCEYGFSNLNAKRGLIPPVTGSYDNWFGDCMGAPIR
ncbi:MAG: ADP-ribosylglycohydrolase family protein, partial [Armatimonadota bacterium]